MIRYVDGVDKNEQETLLSFFPSSSFPLDSLLVLIADVCNASLCYLLSVISVISLFLILSPISTYPRYLHTTYLYNLILVETQVDCDPVAFVFLAAFISVSALINIEIHQPIQHNVVNNLFSHWKG
jgi:hypothetical protein